jgi:nicotinate phosphoribosyltransferase
MERCMQGGQRFGEPPPLALLRRRCAEAIAALPDPLKSLDPAAPYPVEISPALRTEP